MALGSPYWELKSPNTKSFRKNLIDKNRIGTAPIFLFWRLFSQ